MIRLSINRSATARHRGFSLIELIVVLVLMAMLAAAATMSASGVFQRHRLSQASELVEQFDLALRTDAEHHRQLVVGTIDRSKRTLTVAGSGKRTFKLPKQVSISTVRSSVSTLRGSSNRILVNRDGISESYAIELSSGDTSHWILFVGQTGQVVRDLDSADVVSILESR